MNYNIIIIIIIIIIIYFINYKKIESFNNDSSNLPKGSIIAYNNTIAPDGWIICDGSNNTPDLRGRFILGSGQGINLSNRNINDKGGTETHTLTINEIPAHNHTGGTNITGNHTHQIGGNISSNMPGDRYHNIVTRDRSGLYDDMSGNHSHSVWTNNQGGNESHNNMPPFYILTYIMKL